MSYFVFCYFSSKDINYDEEYDSYRFSTGELNLIVQSLKFYSKDSPVEQEENIVILKNLINHLKNSVCVPYSI